VLNIVFAWEQAVAVTSENEKGFIASHRFPMFVARDGRADVRFARDFFLRPRGKWLLAVASPGGAGRNKTLGQTNFAELSVVWPSQSEQKKIADFLGVIDARIALLTHKAESLTRYKREVGRRLFTGELRFRRAGGLHFPDWDWVPIADIGETFGGLTGKTAADFGEGVPFVTYKQVFDAPVIDLSLCQHVRLSAGERQNRLKKGDIIFTGSSETPAEVAFASVIREDVPELYLNSFCFALRPFETSKITTDYARHLFRSALYRRLIYPLAQGSTRYNLSRSGFLKLRLPIPHREEQEKMATFLTNLDDKVDAVRSQIIAMQAFKKGLLQRMFV
jgi:type I restriction enzyme S subunit